MDERVERTEPEPIADIEALAPAAEDLRHQADVVVVDTREVRDEEAAERAEPYSRRPTRSWTTAGVASPRGSADDIDETDDLAELNRDARFDPGELGVEVDDGIVTLRRR